MGSSDGIQWPEREPIQASPAAIFESTDLRWRGLRRDSVRASPYQSDAGDYDRQAGWPRCLQIDLRCFCVVSHETSRQSRASHRTSDVSMSTPESGPEENHPLMPSDRQARELSPPAGLVPAVRQGIRQPSLNCFHSASISWQGQTRKRVGVYGFRQTCWNYCINWSGRRDSNPRPQPWQGYALPLSYARVLASARVLGGFPPDCKAPAVAAWFGVTSSRRLSRDCGTTSIG